MTLQEHGQPADTTTRNRNTGLIAVVAIVVVALLGLGGWLIVNSQESMQPDQVTGLPGLTSNRQFSPVQVTGGSDGTPCDIDEDNNYACTSVMSDPRVSGIETFHLPELEFTEDEATGITEGTWTTTATLTNEGGSWTGVQVGSTSWTSERDWVHQHVIDTEYTGTGAYEGLVYRRHNEFIDPVNAVSTGTIEQAE